MTVRFEENPYSSAPILGDWSKKQVPPRTWLIFDRGFDDFQEFAAVVDQGADWITRLKTASYKVQQTFTETYALRDQKIL